MLASHAEVFVNDAFGTAHRAHASTFGLLNFLPVKVSGYLIAKELEFLGEKTSSHRTTFYSYSWGAKVSDKIMVIDALLDKADAIIIGGAMAYTFAMANGKKVGDSLCEPDKVELAKSAIEKAREKGVRFLLPVDTLGTNALDFDAKSLGETKIFEGDIDDGWEELILVPKQLKFMLKKLLVQKQFYGMVLWGSLKLLTQAKVLLQLPKPLPRKWNFDHRRR